MCSGAALGFSLVLVKNSDIFNGLSLVDPRPFYSRFKRCVRVFAVLVPGPSPDAPPDSIESFHGDATLGYYIMLYMPQRQTRAKFNPSA